jgi:hypothetical protein
VITLLSDQLAPVTSAIGFIELPLEDAARELTDWRFSQGLSPEWRPVGGTLPEQVLNLAPLVTGAPPRELLVGLAESNWTAYFDCGLPGSDPVGVVGRLTRTAKRHGVVVRTIPHTIGTGLEEPGRAGAVQFVLLGPLPTDTLNYVRSVSASYDGSRWMFATDGTPQMFEDAERYKARRIRDRITSQMVADYCEALGLFPFNPTFYSGRGILVSSTPKQSPGRSMALSKAQQLLGIVPGACDHVSG